jgi:AcrR family transcriptional regulator
MARKSRKPEVVEKVKNDIIEAALALILDVGFSNMSMRKLADKVNMTATNLYYYYSNKDEIYLNLQIKGFNLLVEILKNITATEKNPCKALEKMVYAYLEFGFKNPDYYRIMLNSDTPRYSEYRGTNVEPIAFLDKQIAIGMGEIAAKVITEIAEINPAVKAEDADFLAKKLWITLHGILVLSDRNILSEADDNPEKLIQRMCKDLLAPFQM